MPNTVVFLWISAAVGSAGVGGAVGSAGVGGAVGSAGVGGANGGSAAPSPSALSDLRDFGAARGLSFVAALSSRPLGLPANDAALADALEAELEQARTALSALEEEAAGERLQRVESSLLAHPHLPQATFLMGECLALQAQAERERAPSRALWLDARRIALEGPRASAFGEAYSAPGSPASVKVIVSGLDDADELELDGATLTPPVRSVTLLPGLHHARVWRSGRPIFATFTDIGSDQKTLTLTPPRLMACSVEDFEAVPRNSVGAHPQPVPGSLACERWAQAREERGGIGVALCERDRCGFFTHWQRQQPAAFAPIVVDRSRFPAWASIAIAGATVALASSLVLWQAGAFDRGHPTAATWEYGGLNPQAIRF